MQYRSTVPNTAVCPPFLTVSRFFVLPPCPNLPLALAHFRGGSSRPTQAQPGVHCTVLKAAVPGIEIVAQRRRQPLQKGGVVFSVAPALMSCCFSSRLVELRIFSDRGSSRVFVGCVGPFDRVPWVFRGFDTTRPPLACKGNGVAEGEGVAYSSLSLDASLR